MRLQTLLRWKCLLLVISQLALYKTIRGRSANDRPLFKYLAPTNGSFIKASIHGYIPIDNRGNDLFYWYFESSGSSSMDPLLVWFTGGPGCSSSLAMLTELGPIMINTEGQQVTNPYSWSNNTNLLFIDNPIGTGFSHGNDDDMAKTEADVAVAISTFFQIWIELEPFKSFAMTPIFITGESYAGHYVPYIANALRNLKDPRIKIKGAAIGNGMINSAVQFDSYIEYSREHLEEVKISAQTLDAMAPKLKLCEAMMKLSPKPITDRTFPYCWKLLKSMVTDPVTGVKKFNWYDVRKPCVGSMCYDFSQQIAFMNAASTLRDLNSDQQWNACNDLVESTLSRLDWIADCSPQVKQLLENGVSFMAFYGDYDWICNWIGGNTWSNSLEWSGQSAYQKVPFSNYLNGIGQIRQYQNFRFIRLFKAGHLAPMDQPANSLAMMNDFIKSTLSQEGDLSKSTAS